MVENTVATKVNSQKTFAIYTLGCRLNHADAGLLSRRLQESGYTQIECNSVIVPEVIVVNSCAVTAEAQRKTRQLVRQLRKRFPNVKLIVAGCAVELDHGELTADGADELWTNPGKRRKQDSKVYSRSLNADNFAELRTGVFPFRSRAFIKIQEGCDNHCSYCIVPAVRGPARSRKFEDALADCRNAVDEGFSELVLTGVNTCQYFDSGKKLSDLVNEITQIPGDFRVRLSSTEPHPGDFELIDLLANNHKVCRFLHLSLQSGCDRILQRMNRKYSAAEFMDFICHARERIPKLHIGTDVIVGFPGETEEDFEDCREFVEKAEFANLHLFIYSVRPGTPAAELPQRVAPEISRRRMEILKIIGEKSAQKFCSSLKGTILPVIFERNVQGNAKGWSDNYVEVSVPADSVPLHKIVNIKYQ